MKTSATYSRKRGTRVYHNNDKCTERNNIENKYKASGTNGRRLCQHCHALNQKGR
jgi:hypothetical protein